jgi:oxygen-dependent protoporphyrinogen oxidase
MGVPQRLLPLARSGLLSPAALARAGLDLVLPRRPLPADPSVGELVRPRLGGQVFDRLVDPLLGGVHAGPADLLSAQSCVPDVATLARSSRSLVLGLRRRASGSPPAGSPLVTLAGGISQLVDALAGRLGDTDVRLGTPVTGLTAAGGYLLRLGSGAALAADAVVLAAPAFATAELLAGLCPPAAAALREIPYADVASLALVYPKDALTRRLDGTGFLVPPAEGLLLVGCSWLPAKWPHLADDRYVLIRAMVGRYGDDRFAALGDTQLTAAVHAELARTMGVATAPVQAEVWRWPRAMPQYTVGHQARLERVAAALATLPGLAVTGAGYRGVGVASCVADAQRAARDVAAVLDRRGCAA